MNAEKILKAKDLEVGMFVTVDKWHKADNSFKGNVIIIKGVSGSNFIGDAHGSYCQGTKEVCESVIFSLTDADFTQLTDEYVKAAGYVEPAEINKQTEEIHPFYYLNGPKTPIPPYKLRVEGEFVNPAEKDENEKTITVKGKEYVGTTTPSSDTSCDDCAFDHTTDEGYPVCDVCPSGKVFVEKYATDENTLVRDGKTYTAKEKRDCGGCAFMEDALAPCSNLHCTPSSRKDKRNIIWVEKKKHSHNDCVDALLYAMQFLKKGL